MLVPWWLLFVFNKRAKNKNIEIKKKNVKFDVYQMLRKLVMPKIKIEIKSLVNK